MSLSLGDANEATFKGVIDKMDSVTLRDHLGDRVDNFKKAMYLPDGLTARVKLGDATEEDVNDYKDKQLDRAIVVFYVKVGEESFNEWMNIPTRRGYSLSNLKKVVDKNALPLIDIPADIDQWIGASVACELNKDNYYRLTK